MFAQIWPEEGGTVASAFGQLVAGTQTDLLAASMGPISSMAQERIWVFYCSKTRKKIRAEDVP